MVISLVILTRHFPLTHKSVPPGMHGVPSITLLENRTENLSSVVGVQYNAHGLSINI